MNVDPYRIRPPHPIYADNKYKKIVKSMEKDGWSGRPLVVVKMKYNKRWDYSAITGSHRIRAARKVGITVPIKILPYEFFKDASSMGYKFYFWNIYQDACNYINNYDNSIPWQKYPLDIVELLTEDWDE